MIFLPVYTKAQIALTTENMALGGGGTAYLTGFESLFVNPANLYIQEKNYRYQISLLQGGVYHDTLLPIKNNINRFESYSDQLKIVNDESALENIGSSEYETLLNRNYPGNNTKREFLTENDFYWLGLKWVRPKRSYAISLRSRYASRYELGKGLFSNLPVEKSGESVIEKSFSQKTQILHEISFGYAESFTYLNGLLPQLSEFIIGIAPKIVFSGSSLETNYTNRYERSAESSVWNQTTGFDQKTSGAFSESVEPLLESGNLSTLNNQSFTELFNPSGVGFGLDIGITYLITFGDDLSVLRQQNEPTKKSLRLSLSVTDLGGVYQYQSPLDYSTNNAERLTSQIEPVSDKLYEGAPNEHYYFLSQFDDFNNLRFDSSSSRSFELLLPTSIQAGALFQYQRIKLVGDFSYSLSDTPFNHQGLASYLGIELQPLPFLPIRAGTRFAREMGGYYSFGTGLQTSRFDLNLSLLLKSRKIGPTSEILGISLLGLKVYFK